MLSTVYLDLGPIDAFDGITQDGIAASRHEDLLIHRWTLGPTEVAGHRGESSASVRSSLLVAKLSRGHRTDVHLRPGTRLKTQERVASTVK